MGTWRRCPKSTFYRRISRDLERYDKRAEAFDNIYVDPVDFVLIRTLPWRENSVQILWWQVVELQPSTYFEHLRTEQADVLSSWAMRVMGEMEGGISRRQKDALFDDLDVDAHSRDRLLDAAEFFVNVSPPEATTFRQTKVPRNPDAVSGLLFHFGVGPC